MLGQNATHANFSVNNIETAKSFYVDKLGFTVKKDAGPAGVMLESGAGTRINVYEKADHKAWDATVLGIEVADVRAAVQELAGLGVEVAKLPMTDGQGIASLPDGGGDAAWFQDPAGNWVCISTVM